MFNLEYSRKIFYRVIMSKHSKYPEAKQWFFECKYF